MLDTGARRGQVAGLRLTDLDVDLDVALVLGKGRRERALPFGHTTAVAPDRYLRVRARHKDAALPWRWLGLFGRLAGWKSRAALQRYGASTPNAARPQHNARVATIAGGTAHGRGLHAAWHRADRPASRGQ